MAKKKETKPAEGERTALGGFIPQYEFSAYLILRALLQRKLERIWIADPEAGRVDDFQIQTHNRVDAYQIKWSKHTRSISLNDLTRSTTNKTPCLIRQLADGWQKLNRMRTGCRVVVHLVTNNIASVNDKIPIDPEGNENKHFAAFLSEAWEPMRCESSVQVDKGWQHALRQLQNATGLSDVDFRSFVKDCELELNFQTSESPFASEDDAAKTKRDIEHIMTCLLKTVSSPESIVDLNCRRLLKILGWEDLIGFTRKHDFPIDEKTYRSIPSTENAINEAISKFTKGYIAILGTPGSGKSTVLTHILRQRKEDRVIRYYAFMPSSSEPLEIRGESITFLHDLVMAFREAGILIGESISAYEDRRALQRILKRQMQEVNNEFLSTGLKTIILVDGLDHVPREYHPDRTFLKDLPLPSEIPDGILFLLGTQTDELDDLPPLVKSSLRESDRYVEVGKLGRSSVYDIMQEILPDFEFSKGQIDAIYSLCDGHPLSLRYLLNQMEATRDVDQVIRESIQYQGSISDTYNVYWSEILRKDEDLARLLGLICRLQSPIDMEWVARWNDDQLIRRFVNCVRHYFRRESNTRWYFFHNSFRVFIEQKTATNPLESYDCEVDKKLHGELGDRFALHGNELKHRLKEIYHRSKQGDFRAVIKLTTPQLFRKMCYSGVAFYRIYDGLHLAFKAASNIQDAGALIRLALTMKEVKQRDEVQEDVDIIGILTDLSEYDLVLDYLKDGSKLLCDQELALEYSLILLKAGKEKDAAELFEIAEPDDVFAKLLHSDKFPFDRDQVLEEWASASAIFRGVSATLEIIKGMQVEEIPGHWGGTPEQYVLHFRNALKYAAGRELVSCHDWINYKYVRDSLDPGNDNDRSYWIALVTYAVEEAFQNRDEDKEFAKDELENLIHQVKSSQCDADERLNIAELIYSVNKDSSQAIEWISGVSQPPIADPHSHNIQGLSPWMQRLRLNSLLYALHEGHPEPDKIIPYTVEPHYEMSVAFERVICRLALIRGRRMKGKTLQPFEIERDLGGLIRFFYRDVHNAQKWTYSYYIENSDAAFFTELTAEISLHGHECLEQFIEIVEKEWLDNSRHWSLNARRAIIVKANACGMPKNWASGHLKTLDELIELDSVSQRRLHYGDQARAWKRIGDAEKGRECLAKLRKCATGVAYRKDYQVNQWIELLEEHLKVKPDDVERLIPWFAQAVATLEESTERAALEAAQELLKVVFRISPVNAVNLSQWFCEQSLYGWHNTSLESICSAACDTTIKSVELLIAVCTDFFMPMSDYVDAQKVPKMLGIHILKQKPRDEALRLLDGLISEINVLALSPMRKSWCQGFDLALDTFGYKGRFLKGDIKEEIASEDDLYLLQTDDGRTLHEGQVKKECSTFEGLLGLLNNTKNYGYSSLWHSVLSSELGKYTIDQLNQIIEPLRKKNLTPELARVACSLHKKGDHATAGQLAEQCLIEQITCFDEWDSECDENAIAVLNRIDSEKARKTIFATLAQKLISSKYTAHEVPLKAPIILNKLGSEETFETVWHDIEDHLQTVFDEVDLERIIRPEFEWDQSNDSPDQALAKFLLIHATHPSNDVRLAAMRGLSRAIKAGCRDSLEVVRSALRGSEQQKWYLIRLVEALAIEEPNCVQPFESEVIILSNHSNYAIRRAGQSICELMNWPVLETPLKSELPAVYHLWLPDSIEVPTFLGLNSHEHTGVDSDDPHVMIKPLGPTAKYLASMANLEYNSVVSRIVSIMRTSEIQETWDAKAEAELCEKLKRVGPRFAFESPRAEVARRAVFYVAAELFDSGNLSLDELNFLMCHINPFDSTLLLQIGLERPSQVTVPPDRQYPNTIEGWKSEASPEFCIASLDGWEVLAEKTIFKHLDDDNLREHRQSIIVSNSLDFEPYDVFESREQRLHEIVMCGVVENYLSLDSLPADLVILNGFPGCNSPGHSWLAANPAMARHFNWRYDKSSRFRWVDDSGAIMVKSVWWQDGLMNHSGRSLRTWVGEGWLVLASNIALQQIDDEIGPLSRLSCSTRKANREEQGYTTFNKALVSETE